MADIISRIAVGDILRRNASRFPEKIALIDGEKKITFQELDELANKLANYLLNMGLKKEDKIVTVYENSWEYVVLFMGIAKAGVIWVPINPSISVEEKKYIVGFVEAKLIIGQEPLLKDEKEELSTLCSQIIETDESNSLLDFIGEESSEEPLVDIGDRDVSQIMFTSGTTGRPKGVMTSHQAIYIASLSNIIESNIGEDENVLAMMPMFHCAQHTTVVGALHRSATTVIINGFEPERLMQTIDKYKIHQMFALPMMYRMMLDHPNRDQYDFSSLNRCLYAMAPMDRLLLERCIKVFDAEFALGTGQTEIYPSTMIFRPEEQLRRFGPYWGISNIVNDTAVMDDDGNILPKGEVGEIVHRGPNVMNGYYKNEEETKKSREFDWHHTGDLGYWDEDGQMVFVDRKKDIIKTGGENVSSMQVESIVLEHEDIANAVVIGLPHEHWAEAVTAIVIRKPNTNTTEKDIIDFCKERLGGFQTPKSVIFVDELPMTPTGKIQKHILRQKHASHYSVNK
ncbi:class I adenylate-forming enzyme family protein [Oceanobacillus salinisoli]|uniref:class I adenylate-forming enzyme family protein n=1 Tax=Oceanobacillus salinisoli TaxID=2678611 RepID=UPI0012E1096B|nr:AMP-binding protein [Oceanobacillus salinisoli]